MLLTHILHTVPSYRTRLDELCRRGTAIDRALEQQVAQILEQVRSRGDRAVRELTEKYDHRSPPAGDSYEIDHARWQREAAQVDDEVVASLERAAAKIRAFHEPQVDVGYELDDGSLTLRVTPLSRVGIYVPGGTALYPSSVLMTAIPAQLAGVNEIIMVTPGASPATLRAAQIAGVHRAFEIGGAQAIAALAYGTESVPRVAKIVGPGNQWVALAKRMVYGAVDIDSVAGPSEVLIVADEAANPAFIAADLLAQAEHDTEARPILATTSEALIAAVENQLTAQLLSLPRRAIAEASLKQHGMAILVPTIDDALDFAEQYAPEHLELQIRDARAAAEHVRSAGAIFVGAYTPEASGDYLAGPNHVLPTGGAARYASPLGVYDFRKRTSIMEFTRAAFAEQVAAIVSLATVEGLDAHARSARIRIAEDEEGQS